MSIHDQSCRTVELPALLGKLREIDALLQAARSSGAVNSERVVLNEIARAIGRSSGGEIYQKSLGGPYLGDGATGAASLKRGNCSKARFHRRASLLLGVSAVLGMRPVVEGAASRGVG